jgi:hypothetical protein
VPLGTGAGAGAGGQLVASNSGSGVAFYLDSLSVGFKAGEGEAQVSVSGTGYLELPNLVTSNQSDPTGTTGSATTVTVGGSFNATTTTLTLNFSVGQWNNALGIPDLTSPTSAAASA